MILGFFKALVTQNHNSAFTEVKQLAVHRGYLTTVMIRNLYFFVNLAEFQTK